MDAQDGSVLGESIILLEPVGLKRDIARRELSESGLFLAALVWSLSGRADRGYGIEGGDQSVTVARISALSSPPSSAPGSRVLW